MKRHSGSAVLTARGESVLGTSKIGMNTRLKARRGAKRVPNRSRFAQSRIASDRCRLPQPSVYTGSDVLEVESESQLAPSRTASRRLVFGDGNSGLTVPSLCRIYGIDNREPAKEPLSARRQEIDTITCHEHRPFLRRSVDREVAPRRNPGCVLDQLWAASKTM